MNGRRGVLSAGTWCVDLNKTISAWPVEDTMTYIVEFDRQNGGSGSNMAIDLKRLDPSLPVEAMGVIGDDDDGRFLLGRCEAFGIDSGGLAALPGGATPVADCFNSLESGRRTHFYSPGVAAQLSPDHFDFSRTQARFLHLGLPGAHAIMDAPWRGETTRLGRDAEGRAGARPGDQPRNGLDGSSAGGGVRQILSAASGPLDGQRLRDRLRCGDRDARCARRDARARRAGATRCADARAREARRRAFSRRRDRVDSGRIALRAGVGRDARQCDRGRQWSRRRLRGRHALRLARGVGRGAEPPARPCLRGGLDARSFDDHGRRAGRRMPRSRREIRTPTDAGLTPPGSCGTRRGDPLAGARTRGRVSLFDPFHSPRRNQL